MNTKILSILFFLMSLFGVIGICMKAFNIYEELLPNNKYVVLIPLWVGIIGTFVLKKYETKVTEREMKNFRQK